MIKSISGIISTSKLGYDNDAINYFNFQDSISASLSIQEKQAWNNFVVSCKQNGNWDSIIAIYPILGSTALSHGTNAKNVNLYGLTFTGTSHVNRRFQGDGTTNVVDTNIVPSTTFPSNTGIHMGFYTTNTTGSSTVVADMGCFQGTTSFLEIGAYGSSGTQELNGGLFTTSYNTFTGTSSTPNGFWLAENPSSTAFYFYRNGLMYRSTSSIKSLLSTLTGTIKLTCRSNNSGTISRRTSKPYTFFTIGTNLNNTSAFSSDVLTFLNALGKT